MGQLSTYEDFSGHIIAVDTALVGYEYLLSGIEAEADIILLEDGFAGLIDCLRNQHNIHSFTLISHGEPGTLILGEDRLSQTTKDKYQSALEAIAAAMHPSGAIVLYGCEIGAGLVGQQFVDMLAQEVGVSVIASSTLTGHPAFGGDWDLQVTSSSSSGIAFNQPVFEGKNTMFQGVLGPAPGVINWFGITEIHTNGNDVINLNGSGLDLSTYAAPSLYGQVGILPSPSDYFLNIIGFSGEQHIIWTSTDGAEFQLESLDIFSIATGSNTNYLVEFRGYRDSLLVATNIGSPVPGGPASVSFDEDWDNIDTIEVFFATNQNNVFYNSGGIAIEQVAFGNVTIAAADASNNGHVLTGLPSALTVAEDAPNSLDLSSVSVGNGLVRVYLQVDVGTFSLLNGAPGTVSLFNQNTVVSIEAPGLGEIQDLQAFLPYIRYTPPADLSGDNQAKLTISSYNNNASLMVDNHVPLNITDVNDAPTLTGTGVDATGPLDAIPEQGGNWTPFTGVSISTVETGQTLTGFTLTIQKPGATLTGEEGYVLNTDAPTGGDSWIDILDGRTGTSTFYNFNYSVSFSGDTATVTFTGGSLTASQMQSYIETISLQSTGGYPAGNVTVTLTSLTDSGGTADGGSDTASLSLSADGEFTGQEDTPSLSGFSGTSVTPGAGPVQIDPDVTFFDGDSNFNTGQLVLSGASVGDTLSIRETGTGAGQLSLSGNDIIHGRDFHQTGTGGLDWDTGSIGTITGGTNGADLIIDFNERATMYAIERLIENLTISVPAGTADVSARDLTLTVRDGFGGEWDVDQTVSVALNINQAPTLTANSNSPTFTEGGSAAILFSDASVSTVDGGQTIIAFELTVSNLADGASETLVADGSSITLTNGTSGTSSAHELPYSVSVAGNTATVSFTGGTLSETAMQGLVNALAYSNSSSNPDTANPRTVTLTSITDSGGTAGGGVDTSTLNLAASVSVAAVNSPPTGTDNTVTATEDTDFEFSLADFGFNDPEGGDFDHVTLGTLSLTGGDTLQLNNVNVASGQSISATDIAAGRLVYRAAENANGVGRSSFQFKVNDGVVEAVDFADMTITVSPVNDVPTLSGLPLAVTVIEDTASNLDLSAITFGDVDDSSVTLTLAAGAGVLSASSLGGVVVSGDGTGTLILTGAPADIDSYLNTASNVNYTSALNAEGLAATTLTVSANDGSGVLPFGSTNIDITGTDDPSVISGTFTDTVTEGDVGDAPVTASGSLSISDVDAGDTPSFADVASVAGGNGYGSFELAAGDWTYTLEQSAVQGLNAGEEVTDTHTFTATDGSAQQVTVTITGANDASAITGTFTGSVTEADVGDAPVTASGSLAISDVDAGDSPSFADVASVAGDNGYGSFELAAGDWTYTLEQSAVQGLNAGEEVTDTHTFTATDGSPQQVIVTITGANDASEVTGTFAGSVTEGNVGDAAVTATGSLSISDIDTGDNPSFVDVASVAGDNGYGSFALTAGDWTYTLDQTVVQSLNASEEATDTHTFTATDGSTQQVTVTITGANDEPVISGTDTGTVVEANVGETISGTLTVTDPDSNDTPTFIDVITPVAGSNPYGAGTFTFVDGTWTYTPNEAFLDSIPAGSFGTYDTFTVAEVGGTTHQVIISATGEDDPAVVSGTFTASVAEGDIGDAPVTATGSLSISDVDQDQDPSFADVASVAGDNGYGSFELTAGDWTYTLDQSAVQGLNAGQEVTDTHTFTATDGSTQQVTVTITGANDVSEVIGTFAGSVTEGNVGDAPVTATGSLSISDVDAGDNPSFADVASVAGDNGYGSFELAAGDWTYTLDQSAVQGLNAGEEVTDTHTFTATDGSTQQVTITITGAEDAPVVTGTVTGSVTEGNVGDAPVTATGTISVTDPDAGDPAPAQFEDVAATDGDNGFGSFVLVAGVWTYTLNQAAVQSLNTGQTATDTITYTAPGSEAQQITVTINGQNEAVVPPTNTGGNGGGETPGNNSGNTNPPEPVTGNETDETLEGSSSNDTIDGGAGADTLRGGDGDDSVAGGDGNDELFAGPDDTGDDTLQGNVGNDVIGGGAGGDIIVGGDARADIDPDNLAGAGDDTLFGGAGDDLIIGGSFDTNTGQPVSSGEGNNLIWAGTGDDTVFGDDQDDRIGGGDGSDVINAGAGNDIIYGGKGDSNNADTLSGGDGGDQVFASTGEDSVGGGGGDDTLFGGAGDDTVQGGTGDDQIWGGTGDDNLTGGSGSDTFSFITGFGTDVIEDFGTGDGNTDILNLSGIEGLTLSGLLEAASFTGGNTTLTLEGHGTIILSGVTEDALNAMFDNGQIQVG